MLLFGLGGLLALAAALWGTERAEGPHLPTAVPPVRSLWEAWLVFGLTGILTVFLLEATPGWSVAAFVGAFGFLLLADGFLPARLLASPWLSLRYAALLAVGWLGALPLPPSSWVLFLLLATLPAWQNLRIRWVVGVTAVLGFVFLLDLWWVHPVRASVTAPQLAAMAFAGVVAVSTLGIGAYRNFLRHEAYRLELRRREALSEALFQAVAEGVLLVDPQSLRIVRANRGAAELLGAEVDTLKERHLRELLPILDVREVTKGAAQGPLIWECEIAHSPSRSRPLEALIQSFEFAGERLVLVVLRSLEERRRSEEQVRHALKSEAIGRLAGGVAHDSNNLLMVINGNAELLLAETPPESPAFRYGREIHRAGTKAAQLVSQLLAYSRRQMLQPVVLDFRDVVAGVQRMLARVLGEKVRLEVIADDPVPMIRADPRHLEQVFLYFAENARDAMPEGGVFSIRFGRVELSAAEARALGLSEGDYLVVEVSDTGRGIPPELLDKIFDPFFTTKEVGKGSGLGLASVEGLIRQHGGGVTVESAVGRGTTFRLLLPVYEASEGLAGEAS